MSNLPTKEQLQEIEIRNEISRFIRTAIASINYNKHYKTIKDYETTRD